MFTKHRGIVHIGFLVLLIIISFSLLFISYKNITKSESGGIFKSDSNVEFTPVEIGKIKKPVLIKGTAYFPTTEENFVITEKEYMKTDDIYQVFREERLRSSYNERYVIYLKDGSMYVYDKDTKKIKNISLPKDIDPSRFENLRVYLNDNEGYRKTILTIEGDTPRYRDYVFDLENFSLERMTAFECDGACGLWNSVGILHYISENEVIVSSGYGDSCWSSGTFYYFDLDSYEKREVLNYTNGCHDDQDAYFGMYGNNFVTGAHDYVVMGEGGDTILSLNLVDQVTGDKEILLDYNSMPPDVKFVKIIDNYAILGNKYFNLRSKEFEDNVSPIEADDIDETDGSSIDLPFEVFEEEVPIGKYIDSRIDYKNNRSKTDLVVVDDQGKKLNLLDNFMIRGMFLKHFESPGFPDGCGIDSISALQGPVYLNEDSIRFVIVRSYDPWNDCNDGTLTGFTKYYDAKIDLEDFTLTVMGETPEIFRQDRIRSLSTYNFIDIEYTAKKITLEQKWIYFTNLLNDVEKLPSRYKPVRTSPSELEKDFYIKLFKKEVSDDAFCKFESHNKVSLREVFDVDIICE